MREAQLYWAWDRKQPYNQDGSKRYVEMVDAADYEALRDEVARLRGLAQPRRSGGGMMASEFTAAELATKIADLVFPHTSDQMQRRELEFLLTEFADAIRNERTEA